jgi:lysozyme
MKAATKTVTWAAACCTVVGAFEGCDFTAKTDTIGTGHPLTWCHGETIGNARAGQKFTKSECDAMLTARLPQYWDEIEPCIHVETSDNEKIAYTSTAYNIGSAGVCHSAMVRRLNAGDHKGACDALMQYTHASGHYVQGLANRRGAERKICLTPDSAPSVSVRVAAVPTAKPKVVPDARPNDIAPAPKPAPKPQWAHWWSKFLSWAWWIEQ